jgi:tetratricopeptide (TPR) repeat protein
LIISCLQKNSLHFSIANHKLTNLLSSPFKKGLCQMMIRIYYIPRLTFLALMFLSCANLKEIKQAYHQPNYHKAVQLSKEAIGKDSTNTGAWLYLAKSSIALNKMKQGLEALDQIDRLDPKFKKHRRELSILYRNLGEQSFKAKQYQKAVQYYLAAESRDPKNKVLMEQTAEAAFKANWLNSAKTRYEKCIDSAKDPNSIIQKLNLIESRMQFALFEFDKGIEDYREDLYKKAYKHLQNAIKVQVDFFEAEFYFCMAKGKMLCGQGSGSCNTISKSQPIKTSTG